MVEQQRQSESEWNTFFLAAGDALIDALARRTDGDETVGLAPTRPDSSSLSFGGGPFHQSALGVPFGPRGPNRGAGRVCAC